MRLVVNSVAQYSESSRDRVMQLCEIKNYKELKTSGKEKKVLLSRNENKI